MADHTGRALGKYEIIAEIGRGGFATVYRAVDSTLDREVALKVLHPQLLVDAGFVERFQREARALAKLQHPHIVTVYEVAEAEGRLYIAMQLARGPNLAQAIEQRGRIPWAEVLELLGPIAEALDYAHEHNTVHRDLKPSNILLDEEQGPLLSDFGFARLMGASSVSLSLSGGILGTPAYIAPEVWELDAAEPETDIYALGCIVYEMLTGEVLFKGKTPMQAVRAHDRGPRFPEQWPQGVPSGIESVLAKALARQPHSRYRSASALRYALGDLEKEREAARRAAEQEQLAAQWRAEAEAAMAAGEWGAARMMVARWLAVAPDNADAKAVQQRVEAHVAEAEALARKAEEEGQKRAATKRLAKEREAEARPQTEVEARAREEQEKAARERQRLEAERRAKAGAEGEAQPAGGLSKWAWLVVPAVLVIASLAGRGLFGGAAPTATPTPRPQPTVARPTTIPPTQVPQVTIRMWEQEEETGRNTVLYPLVNEFMAANPNITVEVTNYGNEELRTQFQTASLAGQAPEIIRCPNDFAGPFSVMGIILPIRDMFDEAFLGDYLEGALAGGVVGGTLWGIPDQSGNHLMLLYNKAFIETPPADSDEWIQVAQEHTDAAAGTWGLAFNTTEPFWLAPFLGGFGGWVLDDETDMPTLNTPEMVKALQFMGDLVNKYKVVPPGCDYDTADVLFKEGKAAMLINGDWSLGGYSQIEGLDFGTAPMPMIKETGLYPSPMTSGRYYMISNQVQPGTPEWDAVKAFVAFMTGEYAQTLWVEKFKKLPCHKACVDLPIISQDPILEGSAAQLEKGRGMPAAPQLRCFWGSARPGQQGVIAGTQTPEEAALKMQEDADRCIKEAGLGPKVKVRVGLVTDVGKVNDGTFNEFAYKGMMQAVEEFGLESAFIETLAPTDYEKNIEQFANEGYDVIITVGFLIGDATLAAAQKYPDLKFAGVDQFQPTDVPNLAGLLFSEDQSGFLAGCLAGLMTESDVVGIVCGMEIPPVIKFRKGYEAGVAYVNPDATVLGVYIDSFTDPARGKEAALSQIAEGADVIFGAGGPTGSGGIMGAAAEGVYVIGVDQDEYLTTFGKGSVTGADKLLSSAMKKVDVAVYTVIRNAVIDLWQGGNLLFQASNDGVGLAPFHDAESVIPQEVKDQLTEIAAGMKAGTITTGVLLE